MDRLKYIVNLLIITLLIGAIAIQKDGKIVGNDIIENTSSNKNEEVIDIEELLPDGTRVINSTSLAKDIIGYAGHTPIKLYVKDGIIQKVEFEPNDETPSFFEEVENSGLAEKWIGMSLKEAATAQFDAVSGATFSAVAIIGNVQRAAQYGADVAPTNKNILSNIGVKEIAGLLVLLLGVLITLAKWRNKWLITLQLVLNVAVLGFWCGSFLSLTTFVAWAANGINISIAIITVTMLVIVVIMPLFNRKGSYCHIHCPMGSAQELMGKAPVRKIRIKPSVAKVLNNLRYYILAVLLFMMWLGVGFDLMNYEVFSAFIVNSASTVVLVMAIIFLILSIFIPRPYCRFVCPTGAIITMSSNIIK